MKRVLWKTVALLAALLILAPCALALANITATTDTSGVEEGESVVITLNVTGKALSVAEGTFTYDPQALAFEEGLGGVSDGAFALYSAQQGGSEKLTATLTFKALKAGEAKVEFELTTLLGYDGKALDTGSAQVTVQISARPPSTPKPPVDYSASDMGVKAENVTGAASDMYIWRNIDSVTIPSRYTETQLEYKGEPVMGAAVKDSDAPQLFYLSDASGENAAYYIYDAARDVFYEYHTVSTVSRSYILLEPQEDVTAPEGFSETTLALDEDTHVKAWSREDAQGTLYLLYARSPGGDIGFYLYSVEDEALSSFAVVPARPVVELPVQTDAPAKEPAVSPEAVATPAPASESGGVSRSLFIVICVVAGVLLAALVAVIVVSETDKAKRRKRAAIRREKDRAAAQAMGVGADNGISKDE